MKRATKILTLVTLASAPAMADSTAKVPAHWSVERDANETAVVIHNAPYVVTEDAKPAPISWEEYGRFLGETAPLVGADNRPACGNVYGKAPSPTKCEAARDKAFNARVATAKKGK